MQIKPFALVAAGALAALLATSCAKNSDQSTSTTTTTTAMAAGDATRGKSIYTQNCAGCHGATGKEVGVGPSLANEKSRKNYAATVAWIKDPKTTKMPKLYPAPLSEKDVEDAAAYVQTL